MKLATHYHNAYPPMSITYTKGLTIKIIREVKVARCTMLPYSFRETVIPADSLVIVWDMEVPEDYFGINRPVYGPVLLWDGDLWCNFTFHDLLEGVDWVRVVV